MLAQERHLYTPAEYFALEEQVETKAEYVLIDQYRLRVEHFQQLNERDWLLRVLTKPEEVLSFESLGVEILLEQIYRNVTWEENGNDSRSFT